MFRKPVRTHVSRRRAAGAVTAAGLALVAGGVWGGLGSTTVHADTALQSAEGDAFVAQGIVHLLGSNSPVVVGPLTPTSAYVPGGAASTSAQIVNCVGCISGVLDRLQLGVSTAAATLATAASTNCIPGQPHPPAGISNGPFVGGNGCSNLAGVGLLGSDGEDTISADAVNAQSTTQSCTDAPTGFTNIVGLRIGGSAIQLPQGSIQPNTDLATLVPLVGGLLKQLGIVVILNEQHYDNVGHGLTVNALHVIVNGPLNGLVAADIIVGHAHSSASCGTGTTNSGGGNNPGGGNQCPPGSLGGCNIPSITKTDSVTSVAPGGTVTYTISIAQQANCPVTRITDILPVGFTPGPSTGDFGTAASGTEAGTGQATLTWTGVNGIGGTKNPIVETLTATVSSSLGAGLYINAVDLLSAQCGEGHGQDNGIQVTSTGVQANATSPAASSPSLANTAAAGAPGSGSATGGVLIIGGGLLGIAGLSMILRRRRTTTDI